MSGPEDFDDFLARRKPVFPRPQDDPLEPPAELDRIVLRQARQAIQDSEPDEVYHGPRWGMPVALAATLLVVFAVLLRVWVAPGGGPVPEVTVQNVSQQVAEPATAPAAELRAPSAREGLAVPAGSYVARGESSRYGTSTPTPAPSPPAADASAAEEAPATTPWRSDARSWLAEIERLRASGRVAEADAELAEYQRQHRAYAGTPDR